MREIDKQILDLLELDKVTQLQAIRQYKNYKSLTEGLYHSWPADKMRFKFISLLDDVELSRKLNIEKIVGKRGKLSRYEYFQNIDVCAANKISEKLQLDVWQIELVELDKGDTQVIFSIPDIEDDYEVVKKMMSFYGYYPAYKSFKKLHDLDYVIVTFLANIQSIIDEFIEEYKNVYHVCPSKYDHKIEKNGLVPKSRNENELFSYSGRIFLVLNQDFAGNENPESNLNRIEFFANYLYGEKSRSNNSYVNEKEYTIWKVDVKKALENNINFYIDYTETFMPSVYVTDNIRPELLTKMKTITIRRS